MRLQISVHQINFVPAHLVQPVGPVHGLHHGVPVGLQWEGPKPGNWQSRPRRVWPWSLSAAFHDHGVRFKFVRDKVSRL